MSIPDKPHERLLDRHLPAVQNKDYLEALDRAFEALLNHCTWVFARCWESCERGVVNEVPLLLLRHILEMADAIHILCFKSASGPAQLQVRSLFEAVLYLEFMLEEDTERRAIAYAVSSRLWSLRYAKRLLKDSEARKQFVKEVQSDPVVTAEMLDSWVTTAEGIQSAEDFLNSGVFLPIYQEFKKYKKGAYWYQALDGKPSNLRELAIHLERGGQFILNDFWSRTVHPDLLAVHINLEEGEETGTLRTLRDAYRIGDISAITAKLVREAMELVLERCRVDELEGFRKTYASQITPLFAELGPTEVVRLDPFAS